MNTLQARTLTGTALAVVTLSLSACGGGGSDAGTTPTIDTAQRTQAATTTAANNSNCVAVKPFY